MASWGKMRISLRLKFCYHYLRQKLDFAALLTLQKQEASHQSHVLTGEFCNTFLKYALTDKMTCIHQSKGSEMEPTISARDKLLVRKLPYLNAKLTLTPQQIRVGDVVLLKDPLGSNNYVVRRLAAVSGYEMASNNKKDKPFVLEDGQCWVLSDNKNLKPGENNDSRTYGPISITDIVGRVIYRYQARGNHGFVRNSEISTRSDLSVIFIELDFSEVIRHRDDGSSTSQT
ncbi:uncharacterized protein LOC104887934 [Beta vulgaris subsp. vulgaris]|uniref:uncharacterized protein LOC104887934 n=1 Tax=Beta vulgaris subsp. vulgaris TaxID=3555 RepID=UPI002036B41D|nr:uncharacterized protein LOC104887934 [Beta vulgaris subsp. vulgaris]